jgi:hypothetical protein
MDNNRKLFEKLLKADGINPAAPSESERIAFAKILDQQLKPSILRLFIKSKITKFAAAAMILIALSCWFAVNDISLSEYQEGKEQIAAAESQTPAELMTLASLRLAMQEGGVEAVEKQVNEASKMFKPISNNEFVNERHRYENDF